MQDYTPVMKVLEDLKCTTCPETNLIFSIEFELLLGDSREISAYISQKAINIDTSI